MISRAIIIEATLEVIRLQSKVFVKGMQVKMIVI